MKPDHTPITSPYHHHLYNPNILNDPQLPQKPKHNEDQPQQQQQTNNEKALVLVTTTDGATIEVPKRPRGRPPGSKNKPKPPIILTQTQDPKTSLRPHILEVPAGHDVIDSLSRFAHRRNMGLCVLAGTGAVANVSLHQPPPAPAAAIVSFHGRFEVLSMSATFMPKAMVQGFSFGGLGVSLAGPQGRVLGGIVAGPLVAATTVTVVCAAFGSVTVHRLPGEDEGTSGDGDGQEREFGDDVGNSNNNNVQVQENEEMCGYSGHYPADVMWSGGRTPPPPGF